MSFQNRFKLKPGAGYHWLGRLTAGEAQLASSLGGAASVRCSIVPVANALIAFRWYQLAYECLLRVESGHSNRSAVRPHLAESRPTAFRRRGRKADVEKLGAAMTA